LDPRQCALEVLLLQLPQQNLFGKVVAFAAPVVQQSSTVPIPISADELVLVLCAHDPRDVRPFTLAGFRTELVHAAAGSKLRATYGAGFGFPVCVLVVPSGHSHLLGGYSIPVIFKLSTRMMLTGRDWAKFAEG
jgi:hypothetical protein